MLNELGKVYLIPFKLSVVEEIERTGIGVSEIASKYKIKRESSVSSWLRKFSNFDLRNKTTKSMEKDKTKELYELEERVRFLES